MSDEWEHGYTGERMARSPVVEYVQQVPSNIDKAIYFVACRFKHWDDPRYADLYPPDDMSLKMYRTKKACREYAQQLMREGHRVIVGELTPRRLIEVAGEPLSRVALNS